MDTVNQYTNGNDFLLDSKPYSGYYNILDGIPYTGRSFDDKTSKKLYTIPPLVKAYDAIKQTELGDVPMPIEIIITEKDQKKGWLYRYFAKRRNDENASIVEIDESQYQKFVSNSQSVNHNLYKTIRLRWKISGPLHDVVENGAIKESGVIDTNLRTLSISELSMSGIRLRLSNPMQFYIKDDTFAQSYS